MDLETARRTTQNRFIGRDNETFKDALRALHRAGESFPLNGTVLNSTEGDIFINDPSLFGVQTVHGLMWIRDPSIPNTTE